MLVFLGVLYNLAFPYWESLKKELAQAKVPSMTILHAPSLVTHPIGILALVLLGMFSMPSDPVFYISWFALVLTASLSLVLNIWGMLRTQFFGAQVLSQLGFLTSTIAAILILKEQISPIQITALAVGTIAILLFAWPKQVRRAHLVWDTGVLYILLSLVTGAFSTILYKTATLHTPSYATFLSGRFVTDFIGWTAVCVFVLVCINRRNPVVELKRLVSMPAGRMVIVGISLSSLLGSFLVYSLPVITFAMLGILTIPSAYLWSRLKYKESISLRMWAGTALSLVAVVLFFCQLP